MEIFDVVSGFEWDENNITKNWFKHRVYYLEAEEVFFNKPLIISVDIKHSIEEKRYYALGITNKQRHLFVVFTIRKELIRIISARDMNKNEREKYYEKSKENS